MSIDSTARNLVIAGAGGLGSEAAWVAAEMNRAHPSGSVWNIRGFLDENQELRGTQVAGLPVLGTLEDATALFGVETVWYICAIGDNGSRAKVAQLLGVKGWRAATLVHPSAIVADSAKLGGGSYVGAGAIICPNARTGDHVIVNTHASVGHDAVLGNFVQICPGARISGGCHIGDHAFLGSNAAVLPGIAVGGAAVVGASSQVIRNVRCHATVVGVPARFVCNSNQKS